jgi:copper homeostasis protein
MQKAKPTIRDGPVLEVIACSVSDAIEAQRGGAGRLEIIRDFHRGGLTPSLALVRDILDAVSLPVRVMLREHEAYEVDDEDEIEELCATAIMLSHLDVDGLVLGFLQMGVIDTELTERVLSYAPNLNVTFHHAFEEVHDPLRAIQDLKGLTQVDRILTHGASGEWPEKIERLSRYRQEARPEIEILAGGGIDERSIQMICQSTAIREFHVGRAAREPASASGVVRSELVKALVEMARTSC